MIGISDRVKELHPDLVFLQIMEDNKYNEVKKFLEDHPNFNIQDSLTEHTLQSCNLYIIINKPSISP